MRVSNLLTGTHDALLGGDNLVGVVDPPRVFVVELRLSFDVALVHLNNALIGRLHAQQRVVIVELILESTLGQIAPRLKGVVYRLLFADLSAARLNVEVFQFLAGVAVGAREILVRVGVIDGGVAQLILGLSGGAGRGGLVDTGRLGSLGDRVVGVFDTTEADDHGADGGAGTGKRAGND